MDQLQAEKERLLNELQNNAVPAAAPFPAPRRDKIDANVVFSFEEVIASISSATGCVPALAQEDAAPYMVVVQDPLQYRANADLTLQPHVLSSLQEKFATHVMCNFAPRDPKKLPMARWVTLRQLIHKMGPSEELRQLGSDNFRQLITEWYKDDDAFVDLPFYAWSKRLKDLDPHAHPRSLVHKFSFEYTPLTLGAGRADR